MTIINDDMEEFGENKENYGQGTSQQPQYRVYEDISSVIMHFSGPSNSGKFFRANGKYFCIDIALNHLKTNKYIFLELVAT